MEGQSEYFKKFVSHKEFEVKDTICLLDDSAKKLEVLEDYLVFRTHDDDFVLTERMAEGLGHLLGDIGTDIRLVSEDMTMEILERSAKREKKEREEKAVKKGPGAVSGKER